MNLIFPPVSFPMLLGKRYECNELKQKAYILTEDFVINSGYEGQGLEVTNSIILAFRSVIHINV